jgi:hypothetical protein
MFLLASLVKSRIPLLSAMLLAACASPAEHFSTRAKKLGFAESEIYSGQFRHRIFTRIVSQKTTSNKVLHVYLDGDGTPWQHHQWPAKDPTSRNTIILELMSQDNASAMLLGRPCYHGFNKSSFCNDKFWTSHRYSETVVSSMSTALKKWVEKSDFKKVVLIGYSGGGTLAMLIAQQLPNVAVVVTIAANLDVDAWSAYHHSLPLTDSLNPLKLSLSSSVKQIHLAGMQDRVVPADLVKAFAEKQENSRFIAYPDFNHHCCWVQEWRTILLMFQ